MKDPDIGSQIEERPKQNFEEEDQYKSLYVLEVNQVYKMGALDSDKGFKKNEIAQKYELDSNFDSPYDGDDKFCLDIIGKK